MSPLNRLAWLRDLAADRTLPPSALAVAVVIAWHVNHDTGDARPAKATIAEMVGTDERAVRRMCAALSRAGWLSVVQTPGRACCSYTPTNPGTATRVQPGHSNPGSDANPGTATRVPGVANPGRAMSPTRAPSPSEQGMNKENRGAGATSAPGALPPPPTAPADPVSDALAVLKRMRCPMTSHGEDITGEWRDLLNEFQPRQVIDAARPLHARDRWPSQVRTILEAETAPAVTPLPADPFAIAAEDLIRDRGAPAVAAAFGKPDLAPADLLRALAENPKALERTQRRLAKVDP